VAVVVAVAVAVAVAVGGDSGGGLLGGGGGGLGGGGSVMEVVVSSSMFVVGRVPSAVVEGCVRSICVPGRPPPSVNLSSRCTPAARAVIKATSAPSTNTACSNPKRYPKTEFCGGQFTAGAV
jgi:hypothetical protein